jgi:hypothetical protein
MGYQTGFLVIVYRSFCVEDFRQNIIVREIITSVKTNDIGSSELLFFSISGADDVNILNVSPIAPKLNIENRIASTFHLFMGVYNF